MGRKRVRPLEDLRRTNLREGDKETEDDFHSVRKEGAWEFGFWRKSNFLARISKSVASRPPKGGRYGTQTPFSHGLYKTVG